MHVTCPHCGAATHRSRVIVVAGVLIFVGFFLPWFGVGPLKVSGVDIANGASEFDEPWFAILWLIPLLGGAIATIEGATNGEQRPIVFLLALVSLMVLFGTFILGGDGGKPSSKDGGLRFLKYCLQIGTLFCVGGPITVMIGSVKGMGKRPE